ncbi:unnamed protein product [Durusdinium trenchii]|uniref:Uncharacterized protein n=1 Tax=Durusdinium trenchii TaxID=1381693 RepID=A0ABP0QPE0_9DINO
MDLQHDTLTPARQTCEVMEEHKANHAKLASDVRAREASHATLADRLGYLEQRMGDSLEKHAQELAAAVAKMDAMHGRVSEERVAREAHVASLESLKKAHGSLASEKQALEKHHATLAERIDYLEKALGDSSEKHTRELEALKAAHQKVVAEHKGKEQSHGQVADRLSQLQREKEDLHARHMSLGERVDYLEKLLGESAEKHMQELEKFKAKHAKDLDASASKFQSHHLGLQERLEYVEGKIGDSAEKHAKELSNMHAKVEQLHGKLQEEKNQREEKLVHLTGHVREQVSGEQKVREDRHATMEERLKFVESLVGDNADKHHKGLEEHGKGVKALHEKHLGLAERLDFLEKMLGDSAEKHSQELAAAHQKVEQLHSKLTDHKTAQEAHVAKSQHLMEREKVAREGSHASLMTRLGELEELLTGHSKEHESHRSSHSKVMQEIKARGLAHAGLEERVGFLEKNLGDSADKHAQATKEVQLAQTKLDQVHSRLSQVEKHGEQIDELKKAHAFSSGHRAQQEMAHASLKERVEFLEESIGDNADKHHKALAEIKAHHVKLQSDSKVKETHHETLVERIQYLEKAIGDSAHKHTQELANAHSKLEDLHSRVAKCEVHGEHIESLKKSHATLASNKAVGEASIGERLDYLEKALGDSADRHALEIASAHSKLAALHSRLGDEKEARERHANSTADHMSKERSTREMHHSSLEERLSYVESLLGESVDKQAKQHLSLATIEKLKAETSELREAIGNERQLRIRQGEAITEHLESEKNAREARADQFRGRVPGRVRGDRADGDWNEQLAGFSVG